MPAKRKKKKKSLPRWQVTGLIVVTVVLLAAVIWYLMGGFLVDHPPFEQRLEEIAEARGIPEEAIVRDDPIRKAGKMFIRTWRFSFPDSSRRDGFLGDLETRKSSRRRPFVCWSSWTKKTRLSTST